MIFEFLPSRLFRTVFFILFGKWPCLYTINTLSNTVYELECKYASLFPISIWFWESQWIPTSGAVVAGRRLSVCMFARLSYQKILEEKFQFQTLASTLFVGILNIHIFRRCMDDKFLSNCAAPRRLARKNKMKIKIQMKAYMYIKFISGTGKTRLTRCRLHCFFAWVPIRNAFLTL